MQREVLQDDASQIAESVGAEQRDIIPRRLSFLRAQTVNIMSIISRIFGRSKPKPKPSVTHEDIVEWLKTLELKLRIMEDHNTERHKAVMANEAEIVQRLNLANIQLQAQASAVKSIETQLGKVLVEVKALKDAIGNGDLPAATAAMATLEASLNTMGENITDAQTKTQAVDDENPDAPAPAPAPPTP